MPKKPTNKQGNEAITSSDENLANKEYDILAENNEEDEDEYLEEEYEKGSSSKQEERRAAMNQVRVKWFLQCMSGEIQPMHRMHIKQSKKVLLTSDQQMSLGKLIQAGICAKVILAQVDDSIKVQKSVIKEVPKILELLKESGVEPSKMTRAQIKKTHAIMADGENARYVFAEKNLGLVEMLAGRKARSKELSYFDTEEIRAEGRVGLMTAIDKFNPEFGLKFSTSASFWINQAILSYLDSKTKTIKMPTHMNTIYKNIQFAQKELLKTYADESSITDEMIADWLAEHNRTIAGKKIDLKMIQQAKLLKKETISYETPVKESGDKQLNLIDLIEGNEIIEEDALRDSVSADGFNSLLALIEDNRKREILREWYSSDEQQELVTISNVARRHGLTKERVKQLKIAAENELRKKLSESPEQLY